MSRKIVLTFLILIMAEWVAFWMTGFWSADQGVRFQLAARFSARISLFIFLVTFSWTGLRGLTSIFDSARLRPAFLLFISAFAFNHLIHFGYLSLAHSFLNWQLLELKSIGGAIAYLFLLSGPIYLWNKKNITRQIYWSTFIAFFYLEIILFVSYFKRWDRALTFQSPKEFYIGCLVVLVLVLVLNIWKIITERKIFVSGFES